MFLRLPFAAFPALGVAILVALAALFSSSLASPGTAHADHSSRPTVSIASITPEVGEEGRSVTVTLKLSRPLTDDEKYCYNNSGGTPDERRKNEVCIEGGVKVRDNYNDHLNEDGHNPSDDYVKLIFRGSQVEDRLTVPIPDDECITPDRQLEIWIAKEYQDRDEFPDETKYGYDIDTTRYYVPVIGNDDDDTSFWPEFDPNTHDKNSTRTCAPIEEGAKEDGDYNRSPLFGDSDKSFTVAENTEAGENIGSPVTATDPDEDDDLTYSLTGTDPGHFDINPSTGQILSSGELNFEDKHIYHLAVSVTDGMDIHGNSDTSEDDSIDVTITVDDVNEPPVFDASAPTTLNVVENTATGENIGNPVTATDPEGLTVTYELDDGDGASFDIDTNTGQIKTKASLMDESQASYTVTVTASDPSDNEAEHEVTITVTDANDPPVFTEEYPQGETSLTRSVAENTAAGEPVGAPVAASDEENDTLTYTLTGTDAASFEIEGTSGQIKTKTGVDLDFESGTTSYSVTVLVHDGKDINSNAEGSPTEDATIDVTINVTDVNEGPAFADDAPATLEVEENTVADTNIGSAYTATDPEGDTPLTYSLAGTDAASFAIDTTTGQLKTKADLDHETEDTYEVTIQVTDGKAADGTTEGTATIDDTHAVTITVTDADDQGSITLSALTPTVNSSLTATLTDQDGGVTGETWEWEISPNGTNTWTTISGETTSSYTPVAADQGKYLRVSVDYIDALGSGKSAESEVSNAVVVRPATNEHPEFTDATTTRSVPENTPALKNIGAPVLATHADSKGTLVYSLSGTDVTSFAIDTTTGQLKTHAALDYEDKDEYTVTVSVSDELDNYEVADTVADDTVTVTITVTDVNEPPAFNDGLSTAESVAENTTADTNIGSPFTATDPDTTGDTLEYSLPTTGDSAAFAIDSTSGQLKTKDPLDFEAKATYTVRIHVTDKKAPDGTASAASDATHTVTITVTDEDEDGTLTLSSEHPRIGAPLTATLTEQDTGVTSQVWKWEISDDGNAPWTVIPGETDASYTPVQANLDKHLRVTVTYDDTHGTDKELTEQADNAVVENTAPDFGGTTTTRSVAENTPAGRNIGAPVAATDSDTGIGDKLTYTLSGTNASSFEIVPTTGQLQTRATLDFETKSSYSVVVTATDTASATDTITVTINITDVSEGVVNNGGNGGNGGGNGGNGGTNTKTPSGGGISSFFTPRAPQTPKGNQVPKFTESHPTSRSVAEATAEDTNIGSPVSATDGDNDTLTYSLGGTDAASFSIDTTTGQLKTSAKLDYELKSSFVVTVSVSDGNGGTNLIQVNISVTDVVEVPVTDPDHQVVVLVDPDEETEVTTVGEDGAVTFPEDTRTGPFFVRIDTNPDNCDWDSLDNPPAEELQACVMIEVFDTEGNPITGDNVLDPAITIEVDLDESDIGNDTILGFMESDGSWNGVTITQGNDGAGTITVSISGISGPGTWAVGTNAALTQVITIVPEQQPQTSQQQSSVQETSVPTVEPTPVPPPTEEPTPVPEATSTATPIPSPTPAPTPTLEPTPTAVPQPTATATPTATPTAVPVAVDPPLSQRAVLTQHMDLGAATQFTGGQASLGDLPIDYRDLRIWPLILLAVGGAMELIAIGLFVKEETEDRRGRINLKSFI